MKRTSLAFSAATAIFLSLTTAGFSLSQTASQQPRKLYMSSPPEEETVIARTAVVVLRHIAQARADIHNRALKNAAYEVAEAERLIRIIRDDLSPTVARDRIWIARKHLEYEPAQRVLQDLPPIYASLNNIEDYIPTDKARRHVELAGKYLQRGDKGEAGRELAMADGALVSIAVELPLLKAEKYVTRAGKHLSDRAPGKADAALAVAEEKAQAVSSGMGTPTHQANKSIWQAMKSYSAGKTAEAGTYIEQAKAYLERAAKTGSADGKKEAGRLAGEIAGLGKKIGAEGKEAESALKSAWERSKALAERDAEYLAAGYEREETTLSAENDLIEAKLHAAYGESYQVTTGEPEQAVREINEAISYLKKAEKNRFVDKETAQKIRAVEKELDDLKAHPEKNDADIQERYESIKSGLSRLFQEI